jgi:hypothetical protein
VPYRRGKSRLGSSVSWRRSSPSTDRTFTSRMLTRIMRLPAVGVPDPDVVEAGAVAQTHLSVVVNPVMPDPQAGADLDPGTR